jgi:RNA polymerase sigma-70 factor (ECF subfamily)
MKDDVGFLQLVKQAQLGDKQSMECLAEQVRHRLSAYIYRLTLNHDLTQDLVQETLLKMISNVKDLENPERFWSWIFRTALGNAQHYYRQRAKEQGVEFSSFSRKRLSEYLAEEHDDGLDRLMRKELSTAVVSAMAQLKLTHRSVLTLRCYEQMSYAQIAALMDCKELRARVLFYRAKHSLCRQLARRGFKKSLLLTALGLFELLTAPADSASAAATVSAASLHVGLVGTLVGVAGTPSGVALVVTIAGVTLTLTLEHFVYVALLGGFAFVCFIIGLQFE